MTKTHHIDWTTRDGGDWFSGSAICGLSRFQVQRDTRGAWVFIPSACSGWAGPVGNFVDPASAMLAAQTYINTWQEHRAISKRVEKLWPRAVCPSPWRLSPLALARGRAPVSSIE